MGTKAYLEESASLRAHMVALHAFSTVTALVAINAVRLAAAAQADVEASVVGRSAELADAIRELADRDQLHQAEAHLAAARRCQKLVRGEVLVFDDQVSVYRLWMEEKFPDVHQAILEGLCVFARAHRGGDDGECSEEEISVNEYVRTNLPEPSAIPGCGSIGEAARRLADEVCPALREAREQFELSWQVARVDWPDGGAKDFEVDHYAELDRAAQGFELVLEHLAQTLEVAMEDLSK